MKGQPLHMNLTRDLRTGWPSQHNGFQAVHQVRFLGYRLTDVDVLELEPYSMGNTHFLFHGEE